MLSLTPFNGDGFLHAEIARLMGKWKVEVAFETGTHHGHTTIALSQLCDRTYTAEISEENYTLACQLFDLACERGNIFANLGSSPAVIEAALPEIVGARVLFYLEAHWETCWPLLDELATIRKLNAPPPIIVIHDFKVPDRPDFGFDRYLDKELDFDYVREALDLIYGEEGFDYHFNRIATGAHRGAIFIEPKH